MCANFDFCLYAQDYKIYKIQSPVINSPLYCLCSVFINIGKLLHCIIMSEKKVTNCRSTKEMC